jgi:hypothetical protein
MDTDRLFLESLAELEQKVASANEYDVLAISRLLRLLLSDSPPLIHQVNRSIRLKLRFQCAQSYMLKLPENLRPDSMSSQDGFDPETAIRGNQRVEVGLDDLLAQTVAVHEKKALSVLDVIRYEAHVGGGVHAGKPKEDEDVALHKLNATMSIQGYTPSLRQLQAIGRVVLRGLRELQERVAAQRGGSS